jgi:hypothetical protein
MRNELLLKEELKKETDVNYYFSEYMQKKYFDIEGDMLSQE